MTSSCVWGYTCQLRFDTHVMWDLLSSSCRGLRCIGVNMYCCVLPFCYSYVNVVFALVYKIYATFLAWILHVSTWILAVHKGKILKVKVTLEENFEIEHCVKHCLSILCRMISLTLRGMLFPQRSGLPMIFWFKVEGYMVTLKRVLK